MSSFCRRFYLMITQVTCRYVSLLFKRNWLHGDEGKLVDYHVCGLELRLVDELGWGRCSFQLSASSNRILLTVECGILSRIADGTRRSGVYEDSCVAYGLADMLKLLSWATGKSMEQNDARLWVLANELWDVGECNFRLGVQLWTYLPGTGILHTKTGWRLGAS